MTATKAAPRLRRKSSCTVVSSGSATTAAVSVAMSLLLLLLLSSAADAAATATKKEWTLFHSTFSSSSSADGKGGATSNYYRKRGTITLSLNNDKEEAAAAAEGKSAKLEIRNDDDAFDDARMLSDLDDPVPGKSWYRLKLVPTSSSPSGGGASASSAEIVTTVPLCQVLRSNFRDEILLTFDDDANVLGVAVLPKVSPLLLSVGDGERRDACVATDESTRQLLKDGMPPKFHSKIGYELAVPGMTLRTVLPANSKQKTPPGLKFLPRSKKTKPAGGEQPRTPTGTASNPDDPFSSGADEGEGAEGEDDDQPPVDNSPFGFIKRYWYVFLPLLISNFMGGPPPPEEPDRQGQQQQGQGGDSDATRSPSASAAASPRSSGAAGGGGGGGAQKRRGKRG